MNHVSLLNDLMIEYVRVLHVTFMQPLALESTGPSKRNLVKFSEEGSVWANSICIGCLSEWAEAERENSNVLEFFCSTMFG